MTFSFLVHFDRSLNEGAIAFSSDPITVFRLLVVVVRTAEGMHDKDCRWSTVYYCLLFMGL
jgi:hypothetical protein